METGTQPGKLTRLVANMEWALEDLPGVHDSVEYETRLNHVLPEFHDPEVCTFDLSRFEASVVTDIMRTPRWSSSAASCKRIRSTFRPTGCWRN